MGVTKIPKRNEGNEPGAKRILFGFAAFLFLLGIATLIHYRGALMRCIDILYYDAWLVVTMVAGIFTQVFGSNYRVGKPILDVTSEQLLFPLAFSIIVFYPIWGLSGAAPSFFSFYAAFLNGYFWEQVVSSARPPTRRPPAARQN